MLLPANWLVAVVTSYKSVVRTRYIAAMNNLRLRKFAFLSVINHRTNGIKQNVIS